MPCEKAVTVRATAWNRVKNSATSASASSQARAVAATSGAIARARSRVSAKPRVVRLDIGLVERAAIGEMDQKPAEQRGVGAGRDGQEQIRLQRRHGAARIDDHDAGAALGLVAHDALEQDRMAPGRIGAGEHHEIGEVEIGVSARHRVGSEGTALARDGRRHAEP